MKRLLLIGLAQQAVRNAKRKSHMKLWLWVLFAEVIIEAMDLDSIAKGGGCTDKGGGQGKMLGNYVIYLLSLRTTPTLFCEAANDLSQICASWLPIKFC